MTVQNEIDDDHLQQKYNQLDQDGDGRISLSDMEKSLAKISPNSASRDAKHLFTIADTDNDGYVTYKEFQTYVKLRSSELRKAFDEVDTDHSGYLDYEEVKIALQKLGLNLTYKQIIHLIKKADVDSNEVIDFREWQEMLLLSPSDSPKGLFDFWAKSAVLDIDGLSIPDDLNKGVSPWKYLLSGGVAGAVSRTATAPLDRLKILLQVQRSGQKEYHGVLQGLKRIYQEAGWRGFFRGNGTNVLKIAPETAVKFFAYERVKKLFDKGNHRITTFERFISGASAGLFSQTIIYPMECVKTRLAVAKSRTYSGIMDCLYKTTRHEGYRALYRGLGPALLGVIPYSGIDLAVYETLKLLVYDSAKSRGSNPGIMPLFFCGVVSSTCGQVVSYPLALVRTRLQAQGMEGHPPIYSGSLDVVVKTIKTEGFFGLYRGIVPNVLKVAPSVSISYVVYETMKKLLK